MKTCPRKTKTTKLPDTGMFNTNTYMRKEDKPNNNIRWRKTENINAFS